MTTTTRAVARKPAAKRAATKRPAAKLGRAQGIVNKQVRAARKAAKRELAKTRAYRAGAGIGNGVAKTASVVGLGARRVGGAVGTVARSGAMRIGGGLAAAGMSVGAFAAGLWSKL